MNDEPLIWSHVFHGKDCFYVSTHNRDSSAVGGPKRYAETLVWKYDPILGKRDDMLASFGTNEGMVYNHFAVCRALFDHGIAALEGIE